MKKNSIIIILIILPFINQAQIRLGVQTGRYITAPEFQNIKTGNNICFELSQILHNNLIVTSHVNYGKNRYYKSDNIDGDEQVESDLTNANLETIHVGLMAGYFHSFSKWFNASVQIGVSTYTQINEYPFQFNDYSSSYTNSVFTDLAFPVKASIAFQPFNDVEIAFIGGFYIEPDYPLVGLHFGPQLNLTF